MLRLFLQKRKPKSHYIRQCMFLRLLMRVDFDLIGVLGISYVVVFISISSIVKEWHRLQELGIG